MRKVSTVRLVLIAGVIFSLVAVFLLAQKQESNAQPVTTEAPAAVAATPAGQAPHDTGQAPHDHTQRLASAEQAPAPSGGKNAVAPGSGTEIVITAETSAPPQLIQTKATGAGANLITVAFDNVPVQDVVNMFAQISGANIIMAGAFTNLYITANLKNVDWKSALNLALGSVNLSMIEDASGILMVVSSDVYPDKLKEIEASKPLITRAIVPRYMSAVDLVEQIKKLNVLSPRGTITTSQSKEQDWMNLKSAEKPTKLRRDPTASEEVPQNPSITTAIIISDIREYVDKVEALVQALDKREPQVFIEARIINVASGDSKKLGFDWDMLDRFGAEAGLQDLVWNYRDGQSAQNLKQNSRKQYDTRSRQDDINKFYNVSDQQYEESVTSYEESPPESGNWVARTLLTPTRTIADRIGQGLDIQSLRSDDITDSMSKSRTATAFLTVDKVSLFLSALEKNANAEMISHPQIVVGNRVEAKIHVGERVPVLPTVITYVTSASGVAIPAYTDGSEIILELGLTLWVIPEIDFQNNSVRLTVRPETKRQTGTEENPRTGKKYPIVSSRDLTTRVNVPSGHTVAIGGLVENEKVKREKKVPLLGDIPLLGLLFRHTEDAFTRNNLIILITPTILDDSKPLTGLEAQAQPTIDKLEKIPLSAVKAVPSNAVASVTVGTNAVTPAAGLSRPPAEAPPASPAPTGGVATASATELEKPIRTTAPVTGR
ncbi:MAG: hypothetical protein HYV35_05360 [Lentisphaerae bacterium]|nr:hypothetical protein [Lentisphaerota bacterium]